MFSVRISKFSGQVVQIVEARGSELQLEFGRAIVKHSRRLMKDSVPAGRIYRRRSFKAGDRVNGRRALGPGRRFHRASAKGQPPAIDSKRLYNKIEVMRTGRGRVLVKFNAPYAGYLEFKLDRPFVLPAIKAAAEEVFGL